MKTDTTTLISAMRVLANDIQSADGVANAAIAEAADRLEMLQKEMERLQADVQAKDLVKETIVAQRNRAYEVDDAHLKRIAGLEQERDELKAAVALAIDTFEQYQMDVDTYPPIKHVALMQNLSGALAKHDADVIERFKDELVKSVKPIFRPHIEGVCAVVQQQITQQAKEAQS